MEWAENEGEDVKKGCDDVASDGRCYPFKRESMSGDADGGTHRQPHHFERQEMRWAFHTSTSNGYMLIPEQSSK